MIEKQLRKYILPNILAMTGTSCYVLADTFFIASAEGTNGITALNLVLPVYGLIFAIGSMIGIGSATRYSLDKSLGSGDYDHYFSNSLSWSVLLSLPFLIAGLFFPDSILAFMGADQTILSTGHTYIRIVLCFTPFFMMNYTFTAFVRNDGSPSVAMAATLFSGIYNIIFDYVFMFPLNMGMSGAALATGISPIVSSSICMIHYLSRKNSVRFIKRIPSLKKLLRSCSLGIAAFVGEISSGITTMVFNFILLHLVGNVAVAAYGVIANIALVGTALCNGVSQGLQPMASEYHGKSDKNAEKKIYRHSLWIVITIITAVVFLVLVFSEFLVAIFNNENSRELARYAVPGMRIYFIGFLFAAINIVTAGFYSATGKGKESSLIAVSRGIIAIVIFAFLLSRILGMTGVWLAFPASELFTLLLSLLMMHRKQNIREETFSK